MIQNNNSPDDPKIYKDDISKNITQIDKYSLSDRNDKHKIYEYKL